MASSDAVTVSASVDSVPFSLDLSGQVRRMRDAVTLKGEASYGLESKRQWTTVGLDGKYVATKVGALNKHSVFLAVDVRTMKSCRQKPGGQPPCLFCGSTLTFLWNCLGIPS